MILQMVSNPTVHPISWHCNAKYFATRLRVLPYAHDCGMSTANSMMYQMLNLTEIIKHVRHLRSKGSIMIPSG